MKLGELFVDLGVNSGNALNSLTNFSIKFLAVKNAASQFADSIDGLFGDTARYGQQLIKNNFITGQSIGWMQKMKFRAEQVGASFEDVIGTLKNLQKANADILMGQGNIAPFQKLNIDMSKLREPSQLLDEIMSKLMRLEPAFRQALASELGISDQVLFMYQQKTLEMDKQLLLTQEEADALNQLNKDWIHLQQAVGAWWDKKIAGMTGFFSGLMSLVKLGLGIENPNPSGEKVPAGMSLTDYLKANGEVGNTDKNPNPTGEKIPEGMSLTDFLRADGKTDDAVQSKPYGLVDSTNIGNEVDDNIYKGLSGQELSDYIRDVNSDVFDYNRSLLGLLPSTNISYSDNSQTIINTSDGVAQHEKIANNKVDRTKNQISNLELFSRRG